MSQLVLDLLNYRRLSRLELKLETVNLSLAIREACNQLDSHVRSTISVSVDPNLNVRAHGSIMKQILFNLLTNAVKFSKPGESPRVHVKALRRENDVHIQVKDEGIGIAPQHQERIFQVFERLHNAEEYPGTGIGLAIVKRGIGTLHDRGSPRLEAWGRRGADRFSGPRDREMATPSGSG